MRTLSRNWLRSRILFRLIQRIKKDIKGEKGYSYAYLNISVGIYRETIGIGKMQEPRGIIPDAGSI
jgi:hypothetical protein